MTKIKAFRPARRVGRRLAFETAAMIKGKNNSHLAGLNKTMQPLHTAQVGQSYRITAVCSSEQMPDCDRQLNELGFFAGEQVMVLRRLMPGADPLVVRIGMSTFALRAAEAALVHVRPESDDALNIAHA